MNSNARVGFSGAALLLLALVTGCASAPGGPSIPSEVKNQPASAVVPERKSGKRLAARPADVPRDQAGKGPSSAIATFLRSPSQALATPEASFGQDTCEAEILTIYGTPKYIILEFAFTSLRAIGNCSANTLMSNATLESPIGAHKFSVLLDEKGNYVVYASSGLHYALYERRDATDQEAGKAVINLRGLRPPQAYEPGGRHMGNRHLPALRAMFELQSTYKREPSDPGFKPTVPESEFVDGSGATWTKCPATEVSGAVGIGLPAADGKCQQPVRLNFFDAVEFAAKAGGGWRLPSVREALSLKNEVRVLSRLQTCRGIACMAHYSNYMREHFLGVLGEFWGDTILLKDDSRIIRSKEVLGTAITTDIHAGGRWPVKGFDEEQYQNKYMVYLVKTNAPNKEWDRTKSLVLSRRSELESASAKAKAEEERLIEKDRAELAEILFRPSGGGTSGGAAGGGKPSGGSGSRYTCQYKCTNAKFIGADKTTLSVVLTAASERAAIDEAVKHAKETCYQQTQRVLDSGSATCRKQ